MLNTVEITKPELPSPLPTDHQELMNLFYNHCQALSAQVRENNASLREGCNELYVDPTIPGMLRTPSQEEIAAVMPPKVNAAVILANYNYQVGNGGHLQHHDNGYSSSVFALINLLQGAVKIEIDGAKDILDIVEEYAKRLRDTEGGSDAYRFGRLFSDGEDDVEEGIDIYGDLDTRLYALDTETIMQAVLDRFEEAAAHAFMAGAYRKAA